MMTPSDYAQTYKDAVILPSASVRVELDYLFRVAVTHKEIYEDVQKITRIPWAVVACLHVRESSQNFTKHLHNGDPLKARTVHVPAGRPNGGRPPFTWQESAVDALGSVWRPQGWFLSTALEFCERYNGLGYAKKGIMSPYVWAWTSAYSKGLFVADGQFDPNAVSRQAGCAAIFKIFQARGVDLGFSA